MKLISQAWRRMLPWCLMLPLAVALTWAAPPKSSKSPKKSRRPPKTRRETPDGALPGLTSEQISAFLVGREAFHDIEQAVDGLGPIFNGRSCGECHDRGGGSARISNIVGTAGPLQLAAGGPVIQVNAIPRFKPEPVPKNIPVGRRRAMTTQGMGPIGAVPDLAILAEQTQQQKMLPQIAGVANIVTDAVTRQQRVGRIGQKSQHPNSTSFAAEAYLREMGITTPFFPQEEAAFNIAGNLTGNPVPTINDDGADVLKFGTFMDLLAPPQRKRITEPTERQRVQHGLQVFQSIGCAQCHVRAWDTGDHNVAALHRQRFEVWSDFLLHDMGASGDQIAQGTATTGRAIPGSWMRTTPLWGCRQNPALWHDGSISPQDYTAAIRKHDGQGRAAALQFLSLQKSDQDALLTFLDSL
jgi:CxxC motif-containing protein (DUF1111 family)